MDYPEVKREDVVDDYHGHQIKDPYRYMEDPEDPETRKFVRKNNALVKELIPHEELDYFKTILKKALDYPKYFIPREEGARLFYAKQETDDLQPLLYMREGTDGQEKMILDINQLSDDGTTSSMIQSYSHDGRYMTAHITIHGSDWQKILVRKIDKGIDLEELEWVTLSPVSWRADNAGFYYTKFPNQTGLSVEQQRRDAKLMYHELGTPQDRDQVIFDPEDIEEGPHSIIFGDASYLFVSLSNSTLPENRLAYRKEPDGDFIWLIDEYDGFAYNPIGLVGNQLYLITSNGAPNNRLIRMDLNNPDPDNWEEILQEKDYVLKGGTLSYHSLVVQYEENVKHQIKVFSLDGEFKHKLDLPTIGAISTGGSQNPGLTGKLESKYLYFGFTSFLQPTSVYMYNMNNQNLMEFLPARLDVDTANISIDQVFYTSKDGTEIPMYLIYRDGLEKNGKNPTLLYGYGGFNISLLPEYSSQIFAWVHEGGLYAIANLRGGGEFGKKWHEQALLENKQTVFDDFISAAQFLIDEGYTDSQYLGINGRSNGGLLVGASLVQRPELFGAAIPQVGVLDMLRYPVQRDAGRYWTKEYGNAIENADHFDFLIEYSPYHNIEDGVEYPPTLVTAAESDDRVAPAHSKKFGAALQHAHTGDNPILVRIETKAGHGYGKPISKIIEDTSYNLAFFKKFLFSNK